MKVNEALEYVIARAKEYGYNDSMIQMYILEIRDIIYGKGGDCSQEELDVIFEEYF